MMTAFATTGLDETLYRLRYDVARSLSSHLARGTDMYVKCAMLLIVVFYMN